MPSGAIGGSLGAIGGTLDMIGAVDGPPPFVGSWPGDNDAAWPADWTITTALGATATQTGSGTGRLAGNSTNAATALASPASFTPSDVEILTRVTLTDVASGQSRLLLRWDGTLTGSAPSDGYIVIVRSTVQQDVRVFRQSGGSSTQIAATTSTGFGNAGEYWLRCRVVGGQISVRAWERRDTEPGAWTLTATDNTHATGRSAIGIYHTGDMTGTSTLTVYSYTATAL